MHMIFKKQSKSSGYGSTLAMVFIEISKTTQEIFNPKACFSQNFPCAGLPPCNPLIWQFSLCRVKVLHLFGF